MEGHSIQCIHPHVRRKELSAYMGPCPFNAHRAHNTSDLIRLLLTIEADNTKDQQILVIGKCNVKTVPY